MCLVTYSVVIPLHNEKESVELLYASLGDVFGNCGEAYEIIFVDDGSNDGTFDALQRLAPPGTRGQLRIISFTKRCGKSAGLQAGFNVAEGKVIITLDGDLQDDPREIPKLVTKLDQGYDLVIGWRRRRQDPVTKIIASRIANAARRRVTGETIHDVGCGLRAFRREVLNSIYLTKGWHRLFTAIVHAKGYSIAEIPVAHHPRRFGRSKYGIWDRFRESFFDLVQFHNRDWSHPMQRTQEYELKENLRR